MDSPDKEPGFYWVKLDNKEDYWLVAEVTENYVWTCGWECPIPLETITWGPKLVPPQ